MTLFLHIFFVILITTFQKQRSLLFTPLINTQAFMRINQRNYGSCLGDTVQELSYIVPLVVMIRVN